MLFPLLCYEENNGDMLWRDKLDVIITKDWLWNIIVEYLRVWGIEKHFSLFTEEFLFFRTSRVGVAMRPCMAVEQLLTPWPICP